MTVDVLVASADDAKIRAACQKFFGSAVFGFSSSVAKATEPRHVHVEQADRYAKFWLEPIELVESRGFRGSELRELHSIIAEHRQEFIIASDEHFSQ